MRRYLGLLIGAAVALTALGGCDDRDSAKQSTKTDKKAGDTAAQSPSGRLGAGWHAAADAKLSAWAFTPRPAALRGGMLAAQSNAPVMLSGEAAPADALAAIRAALMQNMLPARASVRIEDLVNRAAASMEPAGPEGLAARPRAILATAPWNDETLLLWVEIPGQPAIDGAAVNVEFDPRAVVAFRTLGDPSALPFPTRAAAGGQPGRVAMIYEVSPQPVGRPGQSKANVQYATLHIVPQAPVSGLKLDQPITAADAVGTIDNAPDAVRLAAAAAGFGELLRGDPAVRDLSCNDVIALAQSVRRPDPDGWRARLIALMYRAQPLIDLPPAESAR
jgi:hypothetical protein